MARVEQHVVGGRDKGRAACGLLGEKASGAREGGEGEKLNLGGADDGIIIPLRLGDLDMFFPEILPGSWRGNRHENLRSCMTLRWSKIVLIVGLPEGSFCRHL